MKKESDKSSPNYIIAKLLLNTLYGRFGMNPCLPKHEIVNSTETYKIVDKYDDVDIIDLKNGKELVSYIDYSENIDDKRPSNVSVSIASAVTAYARVHMSQFKNNENFTLYYSDTDSIDINKLLPSKFIGSELGQMKLEHEFIEAVYLAPKVYGGIIKENIFPEHELIKVKGLKNPISFTEIKSLLEKNKLLKVPQDKWYKNLSKGKITIKEEIYSLTVTENKRELIYIDNLFTNTKPLILKL
jgi:DNA polymerase type B, organellar and viral